MIKSKEELAREYAKSIGDDCLNQRMSPGTPVGECAYIFCGCSVNDAFLSGFDAGYARAIERLRLVRGQWVDDALELADWLEKQREGA